MVQLLIQKDLPCQGQGPKDNAEASPLQSNTAPFQKLPPPLLLATNKWVKLRHCPAEDMLGLIKEEMNDIPKDLGSQPACLGRSRPELGAEAA